jgi:hypothetical protein
MNKLSLISQANTIRGFNAPTVLLSDAVSNSQINLSWNDNTSNETGFVIERSLTSGSGFSVIHTTAADVSTYEDTGLSPETVYYYRVKAINGATSSRYSNEASNITGIAVPTNLEATVFSESRIDLVWEDNSGIETSYEIERSLTSGSGFALIHTTAANVESYSDTGLTENTTYYYRVRAVGSELNSAYSNIASDTTTPAMVEPSDLTAVAASSTAINLEWADNSTNETGFEIHRASSSGGSFSLIHTTDADVTTYQNTGLSAATAYYYKVRAINAFGETAFTAEATATTQAGAVPAAPSSLATSTVTNTSILLTWTDNSSDETGFQIERSPDTNTAFALIHTTAAGAVSYNDTGLDEGRRYYYRIRATNGSGNSAYTSTVNEITTWSTAVAYIGRGTAATTSTSTLSVPLPSSPTEGRIMVMIVGSKNGRVWANTPTGWNTTTNEGLVDYHGGQGTDRGAIVGNCFFKICGPSESGNVSVTLYNTPNNAHGVIFLFEKDSNAFWSIDIVGSSHRTPATTAYSATSWEKMNMIKGDALFVADLINSDNMTWSGQAVTHSGTTLSETNEEIVDIACTVGQQQRMVASLYHVTSNTSNTQKCVRTMTGSTSTTDSPLGVSIFVRLRNARTLPTYTAQPRVWRGADLVHITQSPYDALSIWDGRRISHEGPDPVTTKYTIATFNGRSCMKVAMDWTTGINRRAETSTTWTPAYPIGTQIIEEWTFETDASQTQSPTEWDFMQIHTGSAPGGPYPDNRPLIYLAWSGVNSVGWDNLPGTSPGGELIFINNMKPDGTNYLRHRFPSSVTWGPSKVYRFRILIRYDVASGTPVFILWAAYGDDPFTRVYEDYVYPTVSTTDVELGSNSMVGGTVKHGVYHALVKTDAQRLAQISYGHTGVTLYYPAIKQIVQLPGDSFYFTDYENDSAAIYDLISTSNE